MEDDYLFMEESSRDGEDETEFDDEPEDVKDEYDEFFMLCNIENSLGGREEFFDDLLLLISDSEIFTTFTKFIHSLRGTTLGSLRRKEDSTTRRVISYGKICGPIVSVLNDARLVGILMLGHAGGKERLFLSHGDFER
ncbi:hypothetical protein CDAR_166631 [Caerostris darwini]|uniref:Uncharacterized protein n=1 Tax=Caerostris darwini TaxID=1538125 RepID=A0AAV4NBD2_9ARAC|nr:hypothetical protein CDAR_166631 [Caerostris darwini]